MVETGKRVHGRERFEGWELRRMLIGGAERAYVPNVQVRVCVRRGRNGDLVGSFRVGAGQGPLLGAGKIGAIRPCTMVVVVVP